MHVELPVGAFIAAGLVLIPLPWHWRACNVATVSISIWLFVSDIIYAINSIIWAGNVVDSAAIWCDITTKLQIGANMALPACCLCICIHLERIASVRQVRTTHSDKVRRMIFDAVLCWVIPMVYMALHYIVQGHRFDIIENFGCRPTIYVSIPAIFLIWVPPMTTAIVTFGFAAVALRHFFRRRLTFAKHLQTSNSGLTTSRYLRLMSMAVVQMVWNLLVTSLNIWFSCQHGMRSWISWENVHTGFSQIAYFPTFLIPPSTLSWTYALWWTVPISSIIFFVFFSFGQEAIKEYRKFFSWIHRIIFCQTVAKKLSASMKSILPRCKNGHEPSVLHKEQLSAESCYSPTCSERESTLYYQSSLTKDTLPSFPGTPATYNAKSPRLSSSEDSGEYPHEHV
ncbi:STE3-domain-containing protein [Scleroderma yunnanense]